MGDHIDNVGEAFGIGPVQENHNHFQVPLGTPWKGEWSDSVTYAPRDLVEHNGSTFFSTAMNTNIEPPEVEPDVTTVVGQPGPPGPPGAAWAGPWDNTVTYEENDLVSYLGSTFRAIQQVPPATPPSATASGGSLVFRDSTPPVDGETLVWSTSLGLFRPSGGLRGEFPIARYGADPTGMSSSTAALQNAVNEAGDWAVANNAPAVIIVPAGTYVLDTTHITWRNKVSIDCAPGALFIQAHWPGGLATIRGGATTFNGASITLSESAEIGAVSLSVPSTAGIVPDEILFLSSETPWWSSQPGQGSRGEFVKVRSVGSNIITLWTPVRDRYLTSAAATVQRGTWWTDIHFRGFRLRNAEPDQHSTLGVRLHFVDGLSFRDCEFTGLDHAALKIVFCHRVMVRDSWFRHLQDNGGANRFGYGIDFGGATEGLVANCDFERLRHGFTTGGSGMTARGGPHNVLVTGCRAFATSSIAFDTHPPGANITFSGCKAESCYSSYQLRTHNSKIVGCDSTWPQVHHAILHRNSHGAQVVHNTFRFNASNHGVKVVDGSDGLPGVDAPRETLIAWNLISGSSAAAIDVEGQANDIQIVQNVISNWGRAFPSGYNAIRFTGSVNPSGLIRGRVSNNRFVLHPVDANSSEPPHAGSVGYPVLVDGAADVVVSGNTISIPGGGETAVNPASVGTYREWGTVNEFSPPAQHGRRYVVPIGTPLSIPAGATSTFTTTLPSSQPQGTTAYGALVLAAGQVMVTGVQVNGTDAIVSLTNRGTGTVAFTGTEEISVVTVQP